MIGALVLAAATALAVESWPHEDVDLGRIYSAPNGSGAMVLVAKADAQIDGLQDWFLPRVEMLAGFGVEMQASGEPVSPDGAMVRVVTLAAADAPLLDASAMVYESPGGTQMIVTLAPAGQANSDAEAFLAAHLAAGDGWTGEAWDKTPRAAPNDPSLNCRLEQTPSVVWRLERACEGAACRLVPETDMVLLDRTVYR